MTKMASCSRHGASPCLRGAAAQLLESVEGHGGIHFINQQLWDLRADALPTSVDFARQ